MYGLVNKAVMDLVVTNFGDEKWESIKNKAGVEIDAFMSNESYPDEMTYSLVGAASEVLGLTPDEVLVAFGQHWVLKIAVESYGPMMKAGGKSLGEFLVNLPNFHTRVEMIYPNLKPPRFACSEITENGLKLHYFTHRAGLTSFVIGLVQGLGTYYSTPSTCTVVETKADNAECDIFQVTWSEAA
jgi:hypothetical protein